MERIAAILDILSLADCGRVAIRLIFKFHSAKNKVVTKCSVILIKGMSYQPQSSPLIILGHKTPHPVICTN